MQADRDYSIVRSATSMPPVLMLVSFYLPPPHVIYALRSSSSRVGFWKNAIQGVIIASGI